MADATPTKSVRNIEGLAKKIAESGTTVGLSRYEDQPIIIRDYFFTKNEDDQRDVVEIVLKNGQHCRSGGQLVMTAFRQITEAYAQYEMTMEDIYKDGYCLQAVFHQQASQKIGRQPYWTVVLEVIKESDAKVTA